MPEKISFDMKNQFEKLFDLSAKEVNADMDKKFEEIIFEPYDHINEKKGKGFRNKMIDIYNYWLKVDNQKTQLFSDVIQKLHTISLLIDDIQDSSDLRRGNPTAHLIYGTPKTITAGDWVFFQTYYQLEAFENPKIFEVILKFFDNTLKGQAMETYWRDNFTCPTEEEYLDMINKKTGSTCISISDTLELLSPTDLQLCNVSILLGVYFQISDDYSGLKSKIYYDGKGYCDDIREGKFTHPIIHAVNSGPKNSPILEILKLHTTDNGLKNKCLELMECYGSLEYSKNRIDFFKNLLIQEVSKLEVNPHFETLFQITEGTNDL